jgi:hypothetical protein
VKTLLCEVSPPFHQADDRSKASKIAGLGGSQWVCLEKRNDAVRQVGQPPDVVTPDVLPMVVVPAIDIDRPASKETLQCMQYMHAPKTLNDRKLRLNLPAKSARSVPEDRNTETSLAVNKADDPLHS